MAADYAYLVLFYWSKIVRKLRITGRFAATSVSKVPLSFPGPFQKHNTSLFGAWPQVASSTASKCSSSLRWDATWSSTSSARRTPITSTMRKWSYQAIFSAFIWLRSWSRRALGTRLSSHMTYTGRCNWFVSFQSLLVFKATIHVVISKTYMIIVVYKPYWIPVGVVKHSFKYFCLISCL